MAHNSNTSLPTIYLISGVWGAHEGSLLLWSLVLALWTVLVAIFSRSIPMLMTAQSIVGDGHDQCWLFVIYIDDVQSI